MNIKDIAAKANVSTSTVSKIVNNKDASIASETRKRVLKIIRQYHYTPYAKISSQTKTWRIAVLLRSSISFDTTLDGIIQTAQSAGYGTIVFNSYSNIDQEIKNINALTKHKIDGVIWEPVSNESHKQHQQKLQQSNLPLLTIGPNGGDNSLLLPYADAAYKLTEQLINQGHTNIGCLMSQGRRTDVFLSGMRTCMFDHHLTFNDNQIFYDLSDELIEKISNQTITALVSSHYRKALECYQLMNSLHHQLPDDLSLVSIKNDTVEQLVYPNNAKISTYTIRNADFGSYLCDKLIAKIEKKKIAQESFVQEFHLDNTQTIGAPPQSRTRKITVVGPITMNTYLSVPTLPDQENTVIAQTSTVQPSGSGINQALGIAKLDQRVSLIGNVGSDTDADSIYKTLTQYDIDTSGVLRNTQTYTGKAYSLVNPQGKFLTSVLAGANETLTAENILARKEFFANTAYCLVASDIPIQAALTACHIAHQYGAKVILSHVQRRKLLTKELMQKADVVILGLQERIDSIHKQAKALLQEGMQSLIIASENDGYYLFNNGNEHHYHTITESFASNETLCDAFTASLAAYLLRGYSIEQAMPVAISATEYSVCNENSTPVFIDRYTLENRQ